MRFGRSTGERLRDAGRASSGPDETPLLQGVSGPVLIVDDDATDCRLLREWVEDLGFAAPDIITAGDAQAALAVAVDHCPAVIICDWMLPDGPASALLRDIRQLCPPALTVVISEHVDRARELLAIDAGAQEVVAKREASPLVLAHALRRAQLRMADRAERRLDQRLAQINRNAHFAAMSRAVVHDLKNLMMAGIANLEILTLDLEPEGEIAQRVVDIRAAVERAGELCDDLLTYASAAEQPHECVAIDAAVHEALGLLPRDARHRIVVDLTAVEGMVVMVDRFALRQVIYNLLLNAVEATAESGDVVVSAALIEGPSQLAGELVVHPAESETMVVVEVSNGGRSISPEARSSIFDPFVSTKTGSRGLGLPSVVRAVRNMGGALSLGAGPNRTTFAVGLPLGLHDAVPPLH